MSEQALINNNPHRIYYDGGTRHVGPGGIFMGEADDAKRPGVTEATPEQVEAYNAETRGEVDYPHSEAHEGAKSVNELMKLAGLAGTAPLRGEAPFQVGTPVEGTPGDGTITTASAGATALVGGAGSIADQDPEAIAARVSESSDEELVAIVKQLGPTIDAVEDELIDRGYDVDLGDGEAVNEETALNPDSMDVEQLQDAYTKADLKGMVPEGVEVKRADGKDGDPLASDYAEAIVAARE